MMATSLFTQQSIDLWFTIVKQPRDSSKFYYLTARYVVGTGITSIAINPHDPCISVGDKLGKITQWYCLRGGQKTSPVKSAVHWHAHKVNDLAYTAEGSYLLSGGEEGVMVLWQMVTGHKDFLPRLGSEITSISVSPDQKLYALTHSDNSIRIISSINVQVKHTIMGLNCGIISSLHLSSSRSFIVPAQYRNHARSSLKPFSTQWIAWNSSVL